MWLYQSVCKPISHKPFHLTMGIFGIILFSATMVIKKSTRSNELLLRTLHGSLMCRLSLHIHSILWISSGCNVILFFFYYYYYYFGCKITVLAAQSTFYRRKKWCIFCFGNANISMRELMNEPYFLTDTVDIGRTARCWLNSAWGCHC